MKAILEQEDYLVDSFHNGADALKHLKGLTIGTHPGCIILDLMMPVMSGRQFLLEFHLDETISSIPVIIATAKGTTNHDLEGIPGQYVKLKKPMDIDVMLKLIEETCK